MLNVSALEIAYAVVLVVAVGVMFRAVIRRAVGRELRRRGLGNDR